MFRFPRNGRITHVNSSDRYGHTIRTKNMNFSEEGYIKLSPAMIANMLNADDADFNSVDRIIATNGGVMTSGDDIFEGTAGLGVLTQNAETGAPTSAEGITYYYGNKVVAHGTGFSYSTTGAWTNVSGIVSSSNDTILGTAPALNRLVVGNSNQVLLRKSDWTADTTCTLPADFVVTSLDSNGGNIYIGTKHSGNGKGQLFVWDGTGTAAQSAYPVGGSKILSVKAYDSTVVVVDSLGQLLRFSGNGFTQLAALPIYYDEEDWTDTGANDLSLAPDGDIIYIAIAGVTAYSGKRSVVPRNMSGIWCYDPKVGLYHYSSLTKTDVSSDIISTGEISAANNTIATGLASTIIDGTPVFYEKDSSSTPAGGLEDHGLYYAIKVDASTIKLASSYTNALAGTAINITSAGDNFQLIYVINIQDYGWEWVNDVSSVVVLNDPSIVDTRKTGRLAAVSELDLDGNEGSVMNVEIPLLPNRGYFETPKLFSDGVEDKAIKCHIKYKPLTEDDSIIVKFRRADETGFPIIPKNTNSATATDYKATWSDTNTFTTTADLSAVAAGDEVVITAGEAAGFIAHVSSISESSGTYTVNLDETFPWVTASATSYFEVNNYRKVYTITTSTQEKVGYTTFSIDQSANGGKFLQFKVELRGVGVTIEDFVVNNVSHKNF